MNQPPSIHTTQPVVSKRGGGSMFLRVLAGITGSLGALFSIPLAVGSVFLVFEGGEALGGMIAALIFFVICTLMSLGMLFFAFKPRKTQSFVLDANLERQILHMANAQGGVLSLGSLTMSSALSAEQSQVALDEMVRRGLAATTFDEDGFLLYRFAGLSRGPAHVVHHKSGAQAELDAFDRELGRTSLDFDNVQHTPAEHPSHYKKNS